MAAPGPDDDRRSRTPAGAATPAAVVGGHWFEAVAEFMGPAYLRYSFTMGTEQEVAFLVEAAGLAPGRRVLDVGCGPGRHALALARRGVAVVGVDIAERFVALAAEQAAAQGLSPLAEFRRADARALPFDAEFDAVVSLCQGGFGLVGRREDGAADLTVLEGMARALKPGGVALLSAFSAYFAVRHLEAGETFDADAGVVHERTEARNEAGGRLAFDLWTSVFTPRELRLLCGAAGLAVEQVWAVTPGAYAARPPDADHPEFLVVARRPG